MSGFDYGAFLLLGVDSLIACAVTGPMFIKQSPKQQSDEYREVRSEDEQRRANRRKWWAIAGISALTIPYGISYGVGDGLGYLLGTLFHFSISDSLSSWIETTALIVLGLYWIGIYLVANKMQESDRLQKWSWRGIWVLPVALSLDNLTYGAVTGIPAHESVWASAGLQALASAGLGLVGLAGGIGLAILIPALRTRMHRTFGIVGVGVIATAAVLAITGW
jgi:putative Mn2+ efflux pump MntP